MEMSINRLMLLQQASAPAGEPEAADWLLQMLREQMTAVAQEEGDTLKKAAMIARLGALYLRAAGAAELRRSNKELARRCARLEEQLAALQVSVASAPLPAAAPEECPQPARVPAPPSSIVLPRGSEAAPLAPEPDALRMLVGGPAAGGNRASPPR
jgi:hypothetical protein